MSLPSGGHQNWGSQPSPGARWPCPGARQGWAGRGAPGRGERFPVSMLREAPAPGEMRSLDRRPRARDLTARVPSSRGHARAGRPRVKRGSSRAAGDPAASPRRPAPAAACRTGLRGDAVLERGSAPAGGGPGGAARGGGGGARGEAGAEGERAAAGGASRYGPSRPVRGPGGRASPAPRRSLRAGPRSCGREGAARGPPGGGAEAGRRAPAALRVPHPAPRLDLSRACPARRPARRAGRGPAGCWQAEPGPARAAPKLGRGARGGGRRWRGAQGQGRGPWAALCARGSGRQAARAGRSAEGGERGEMGNNASERVQEVVVKGGREARRRLRRAL